MNGKPANINTPLEPNSEITIEPSTSGAAAVYTVGQLEEYKTSKLTFQINGKMVSCPKFVQVNGSLEPEDYEIKEGDEIETRNFYTVSQIAEFMDVVIDDDQEILVNNREATLDTLVYENFSIEWSIDEYGLARNQRNNYNGGQSDIDESDNEVVEDSNVYSFADNEASAEENSNDEQSETVRATNSASEDEEESRFVFAKTPALEAEERARRERRFGRPLSEAATEEGYYLEDEETSADSEM